MVLDGFAEGKTTFIDTAKQSGYWVWNLNHRNVLSLVTRQLEWDGEKNKNYYNFIDEFSGIANKYLDFENQYIGRMIDRFENNDKANILIIHNCDKEISSKLQESYGNCYNIIITNIDTEPDCNYCKTLNCTKDNYKDEINKVLKIITNNKE